MDDRELLEMAARAAGYGELRILDDNSIIVNSRRWNPLADDGDALRLAVKLNLQINIDCVGAAVVSVGLGLMWGGETEITEDTPSGVDDCAATRRAIVRAATEIGKKIDAPLVRADLEG